MSTAERRTLFGSSIRFRRWVCNDCHAAGVVTPLLQGHGGLRMPLEVDGAGERPNRTCRPTAHLLAIVAHRVLKGIVLALAMRCEREMRDVDVSRRAKLLDRGEIRFAPGVVFL